MSPFRPPSAHGSSFIALPRDFATRAHHADSIVSERSLQRFKVGLDSDSRAFVTLQPPAETRVVRRELAYLVLRSSESLRRPFKKSLPPPAFEPSIANPRYLYRKLRAALASSLIVPPYVNANYDLSHHITRHRSHLWFETSRHVFEYPDAHRRKSAPTRIICYLFAPEKNEDSDRFFWSFVTNSLLVEPNTCRYADDADLVLRSTLTRRTSRGRWYCEIVITPPALIASDRSDERDTRFDIEGIALRAKSEPEECTLSQMPLRVSIKTDADVNSHEAQNGVSVSSDAGPRIEITDEHSRRATLDWSFITAQIQLEVEKGRALDDTTVRAIARRRLNYASQNYGYPEQAGANLASSEKIVRGIVGLYQLGAHPELLTGDDERDA